MTREESWNTFIDELRTYVQEHHHFPNKHTRLLSKVKYTRKKINDGTLEDWKKEQFLEVANMRDMEEHCGGRKLGIQETRKLGRMRVSESRTKTWLWYAEERNKV